MVCKGYLIISVWVSEATGAKSGNGTSMLFSSLCRLGKGYHPRVKMDCSPRDRAHKDSIRTALVPGKGARIIGISHWLCGGGDSRLF
eukprot:1159049-Pelagomonas_calceolata.AAC.14